MKRYESLIGGEMDLLAFLRSKFPMYHQSTFFFRDVQFGLADLLRSKGKNVRSDVAERLARAYIGRLEKGRHFLPIDRQTWVVNIPDFRTPQRAPAAKATPAARPAGAAPTAGNVAATGASPAAQPKTAAAPPASAPAGPAA